MFSIWSSRRMGSCRAKAKIQRAIRKRQWEPFTQEKVTSNIVGMETRQEGNGLSAWPCLKLYLLNISNSQKTILTSETFVHIDLPQKNPVPWKRTVSPLEENYRHEYMGAMWLTWNILVCSKTAKQMRLTWVVNPIYSTFPKCGGRINIKW